MADVLAVRDGYRAQTWTMLIQKCNSSVGSREKSFSLAPEAAGPQLIQLDSMVESNDTLQIQYRGAELKLPASVDMDAVAILLRSLQAL